MPNDLGNDIIARAHAVFFVVMILGSLYGSGTVLVAVVSLLPVPDMSGVMGC
jgi:hypothetical protein